MPWAFISLALVVTAMVADGGTACARLLTFIPRCPFSLRPIPSVEFTCSHPKNAHPRYLNNIASPGQEK
jgi:hypothetical protein